MRFRVKYSSGQTYKETIETGTAKLKQHSERVTISFGGAGKSEGLFTITNEEADRLAHALLLARSTENTVVQFPFGEAAKT